MIGIEIHLIATESLTKHYCKRFCMGGNSMNVCVSLSGKRYANEANKLKRF